MLLALLREVVEVRGNDMEEEPREDVFVGARAFGPQQRISVAMDVEFRLREQFRIVQQRRHRRDVRLRQSPRGEVECLDPKGAFFGELAGSYGRRKVIGEFPGCDASSLFGQQGSIVEEREVHVVESVLLALFREIVEVRGNDMEEEPRADVFVGARVFGPQQRISVAVDVEFRLRERFRVAQQRRHRRDVRLRRLIESKISSP